MLFLLIFQMEVMLSDGQGGILTGWNVKAETSVDTKKDLVQPNEKHLEGIPKFLQQPQPIYYVSKNQPATITCIAQPVSHVNIFCADKRYSYMNEDISASGLRVTKMDNTGKVDNKGKRWQFSLEVRHKDVVEWFSEYRCYCEAWNQIELLQKVKKVDSSSALVYDSYFSQDFKATPKNQELTVGETLKMTCVPPDAKPPADIYWLKNDEKVMKTTHPQVEINEFSQLLIPKVRLTDSGNYSCVARSLGTERTATANVTVVDTGQWLIWSEWSDSCSKQCGKNKLCPIECTTTTRHRSRVCNKPPGVRTDCTGQPDEYERCDIQCDSVDLWTFWSEWSKCTGNPCQKTRKRQCTSSRCSKQSTIQTINCTASECEGSVASFIITGDKTTENLSNSITTHDIAMYVGLFVAISVFLMVVVVIFCLIRRRIIGLSPNRVWRYTTAANGIPMFYPDKPLKKDFSNLSSKQINLLDINQPSLYRSMILPNSCQMLTTQTSDAGSNAGYADVGNDMTYMPNKQLPSLPLIATPLLSSMQQPSMMRPSYSDSKVSSVLHSNVGLVKHVSTLPIPVSRPSSDHYQELGNTDNETNEQSLTETGFSDAFDCENMIWSTVDSNGGRLVLPFADVILSCPYNAINSAMSEKLFLATCNNESDLPKLSANETLLSPVIICGPTSLISLKPFIVTLPHCAHNPDSKEWEFSILTSYSSLKQRPYWQKFLDITNEDSTCPSAFAHVVKDKIYLVTNQLQRYCVVGTSLHNKKASKILRIAIYCTGLERRLSGEEIVVRIYLVPDCAESLSKIHDFETNRLGAKLIGNQKQFLCQDDSGNIFVTITDLAAEWQACLSKNFQEIPFQNVWHSTSLHCSFTFIRSPPAINNSELKISVTSLDSNWFCSISIQQANLSQSRQNLVLSSPNTSPHTSLSAASTQFSNYSAGGSQTFPYFVDDCNNKTNLEPIFRLPEKTKSKLCRLLDTPSPLDNDWRQLAKFLSLNRSLKYFSNKQNPTEILLDLWEAQNVSKRSLSSLIELFRKIGRLDCVAVLEMDLLQNSV